MKITQAELEAGWRRGTSPTLTQQLGEAVAAQSRVSAIRYRSVAAVQASEEGFNFAIFKSSLHPPDSVHVLGPTKKPLQRWP